jgi:dTDP-4-dehydrorhamnose reductase
LFTDEFRTPIPAVCTARALLELLGQEVDGILHIAGSERLSRWEIGQALSGSFLGMDCPMEPGSLKEYVGAPRSPDTSLDCRRAQALLSFELPRYSEWLRGQGGPNGKTDA